MHVYENLVREHELRVAKSLERYELRKKANTRRTADGLVLFATARTLVDRARSGSRVSRERGTTA